MNLKFVANWNSFWMKEYGIPKGKGFFLFQCKEKYIDKLTPPFTKLNTLQVKALAEMQGHGEEYLKDLDIQLDIHYRRRTLDQNALMWALYEIEANEQNGGMSGSRDQVVTTADLYTADLNEWGEHEHIITTRKNLPAYTSEYHYIDHIIYGTTAYSLQEIKERAIGDDETIEIEVIRGTSKFNTIQMAAWIERIFNRLAHGGVSIENSSAIADYWLKFRKDLNDNQIIMHDTLMTKAEYKELQPSCEACGQYIVDKGHLAHIKAVGMGNDRTEELTRNYTSNWLHLCVKCHIGEQHQNGWKALLKIHDHLDYKVSHALNISYAPLEAEEDLKVIAEVIEEAPEYTTKEQIISAFNAGLIEKEKACQALDEIGSDGTIIEPMWIGIF